MSKTTAGTMWLHGDAILIDEHALLESRLKMSPLDRPSLEGIEGSPLRVLSSRAQSELNSEVNK